MKFAPVTLALTAAIAAGSLATPSFADHDRSGRYYDSRNDRSSNYGYNNRYYQPAGDYAYYEDACRDEKKKRRNTGAAVGAVAGAAVGSQVAGRGAKTEGAVLGAVVGAIAGAEIGRKSAKSSHACDNQGAYFNSRQTYAYRGYSERGRYGDDYYSQRNCRWARDYRGEYIRVCPDRQGRYRPTY